MPLLRRDSARAAAVALPCCPQEMGPGQGVLHSRTRGTGSIAAATRPPQAGPATHLLRGPSVGSGGPGGARLALCRRPTSSRLACNPIVPRPVAPCPPQCRLAHGNRTCSPNPSGLDAGPVKGLAAPASGLRSRLHRLNVGGQIMGACTTELRPAPASRTREATPAAPSTANSTYKWSHETLGMLLMWVLLGLVPVVPNVALPRLQ